MYYKDPDHSVKKVFYVKSIIFYSLGAIIFLHLLSYLPGLYRSHTHFKQAQRVHFLNDVSDDLFAAVGNYGFERGRVNVVLNDAGPVGGMEANRKFILARRMDGDKALDAALKNLASIDLEETKETILKINGLKQKIAELRKRAEKDLVAPKEKRSKGFSDIWFSAMTEYIENIEALLVAISRDISDADGIISRYSSLKHEILALRNTAGPEMSIISATILSGKPIVPELATKIESLRVITQHHFQQISFLCQGLSGSIIQDALRELRQKYFMDYVPYRDRVFPLTYTGGPYPYSQEEFLEHGVIALKEIANFMSVIVSETGQYATDRLNQNRKQIIIHSLSSSGSLIVVVLIILFVNNRVIKPIGRLTSVTRKLAKKDLNVHVPLLEERNEIGEMARALAIFKGMASQLEKDMDLLRAAEETIRDSEEKLRLILNSMPDMIIELQSDLKILWANKAALDINPEAIGRTCYDAFRGNQESCEGCYCVKAFDTGKIETGILYRPASETTDERYLECIGIPLMDVKRSRLTVLEVSRDVSERIRAEAEREALIEELKVALAEVKTLSGLLPICANCKKIRDDKGYWRQIEEYIQKHSEATFSHSICKECAKKLYPYLDI